MSNTPKQPLPSGSQQVRANSLNAGIHFRPQGRSRPRCRCFQVDVWEHEKNAFPSESRSAVFWYILKKNLELGANTEERNDRRRARPLHKLGIPCACTCTLRARNLRFKPGFAAFISHISLDLKKEKQIRPSIQFIVFHEKTNRHDVKRLFFIVPNGSPAHINKR